jgi:hypothetical protein
MTKKILMFHYYGGAGGKFIANCLSYSLQVAFANYIIAVRVHQTKDIKLLESHVLKTIPDKDKSRTWHEHEQGYAGLFGPNIQRFRTNQPLLPRGEYDLNVLDSIWLPIVSHTSTSFHQLLGNFKNDQVFKILVDGTPEFIDRAIRLKWPRTTDCLNIVEHKIFQEENKNLYFDFEFRNWNPLTKNSQKCIIDLADQIGIDFDLNLAKNYIDKYVDFHT